MVEYATTAEDLRSASRLRLCDFGNGRGIPGAISVDKPGKVQRTLIMPRKHCYRSLLRGGALRVGFGLSNCTSWHRTMTIVASTSDGAQSTGFSRKKMYPELHAQVNAGACMPLHACDLAHYCLYVSTPLWQPIFGKCVLTISQPFICDRLRKLCSGSTCTATGHMYGH